MTHSDKAALRGEPGYVWRSGQERRLAMIRRWADLSGRILDDGCGLGTYLDAFAPYSDCRIGVEIEWERALQARERATGVVLGAGESLPFPDGYFDFVFSNEVIEHVADDAQYAAEMVRVARPGARLLIFCPNRWNPIEQHGIYWRGEYKFGNIPLVNYLPNPLRNRLAPHVRAYTGRGLRRLFAPLPVSVVHHSRIFRGFDNVAYRWPRFGPLFKKVIYRLERTPLQFFGISHLLVLEKRRS